MGRAALYWMLLLCAVIIAMIVDEEEQRSRANFAQWKEDGSVRLVPTPPLLWPCEEGEWEWDIWDEEYFIYWICVEGEWEHAVSVEPWREV